jgi:hypothetical protein
MTYVIPHTSEWFKALEALNPAQAAMTKQLIDLAGKAEVCSACGDFPTTDYKVVGVSFAPGVDATIRLCDDCRDIRTETQGESYEPLKT